MALSLTPNQPRALPTLSNFQTRTQHVFGVLPCLWQVKVAEEILKGEHDIICIAGTGMGKTLTFWMPLLFRPGAIQIVVTPLNLLGKQNVASLDKAGIRAISISSETATPANFQAISAFKYQVVVISPEQIMKPDGGFERLLKNPLFTQCIISIIIDEAHCLTDWGEFRPEYRELGQLQYVVPMSVPLLVTSATITKGTLRDLTHLLHMSSRRTVIIHWSSDHPNIGICVKKIKYALNSFADLTFLVPAGFKVGDPPPPKFLIFFDDIPASINAACVLRHRLPRELKEKIRWFNTDMSTQYKETELQKLTNGETWGLCTTTSFGMGMDVPDILLVIQWRATCKLAALWQRFGRAARDKQLTGTAILFAEKEHFDDERAAKEARRVRRTVTRKWTAKDASLPSASHPVKRAVLSSSNGGTMHDQSDIRYGVDTMVNADLNGSSDEESDDEESLISADTPGTSQDTQVLLEALAQGEDPSSQLARAGKKRKGVLDAGTDFLINAEKRTGMMCRRKVFDVCFDNGTAGGKNASPLLNSNTNFLPSVSDHHKCNTDNVQGCPRCCIMEPIVCCDIHNPADFASYDSPNSKASRATHRSRLPKYTRDKNDYDLENALLTWREEKTVAVYGWACLYDNGPVVMTNSTLDRIIDCAHHHKIQTPQDLKRETVWADSNLYAAEVVSLVQRHAALRTLLFISTPLRQDARTTLSIANPITVPVPTPDPTMPQLTSSGNSSLPMKRRAAKCSACGQEGHNGSSQSFVFEASIPHFNWQQREYRIAAQLATTALQQLYNYIVECASIFQSICFVLH
ncbi:P-loop containing nucleoside triphosphate hydrolase protein [Pisolithus albus]|nr:P-loop containing nucleoside triphosphate hydrolase protein [Pisolithus albus]